VQVASVEVAGLTKGHIFHACGLSFKGWHYLKNKKLYPPP
jgi:hypothetical protein